MSSATNSPEQNNSAPVASAFLPGFFNEFIQY
jgi:hypothetical protein